MNYVGLLNDVIKDGARFCDADGASAWTGEMGQKQTLTLQHNTEVKFTTCL